MSTNVVIPSLGLTMEEGTIVQWLKQDGDQVEKDEAILMIETDKATVEMNSPAAGVLGSICAAAGDVIPVGGKIAVIYSPEEYQAAKERPDTQPAPAAQQNPAPVSSPPASARQQDSDAKGAATLSPSSSGTSLHNEAESSGRRDQDVSGFIKASPAARKLARELQVDLRGIVGSGPGGRILESNVSAYRQKSKDEPVIARAVTAGSSAAMTGMRKVIARRMVSSRQTTASVTIFMEVRMDEAVRVRTQMNAGLPPTKGYKITYDAIIAKAVSLALQDHPVLQAQWGEDRLIHPDGVHIGIAVALPDGLVVPVVRNTENRSLFSIAKEIQRLAETAKKGDLSPDAMSGGTFTITNLGMYPVKGFTPVINLPEAAILGIGAIKPQAIVENEKLAVGQMAELSLTFDHRIVDGAPAAAFLAQIKSLLEQPYQLFIEE